MRSSFFRVFRQSLPHARKWNNNKGKPNEGNHTPNAEPHQSSAGPEHSGPAAAGFEGQNSYNKSSGPGRGAGRGRIRVPMNGHPAGYVLVAVLAASAAYGIATQASKDDSKRKERSPRKEKSDSPSTASSVVSSSPPIATTSTSLVPFTTPRAPMQPYVSETSALPTVNILTELTSNQVASHPLLNRVAEFGLPQLPLRPLGAQDSSPPFHLSPPLILRHSYLAAYNSKTRTSDWVLERLVRDNTIINNNAQMQEKGNRSKCDFSPDPLVASGFQSHTSNYRNTHYDRGHLVPAADSSRASDGSSLAQEALCETFALTNVAPQNPELNRKYWCQLESHIRSVAHTYGEVFVVTGPLWIPQPTSGDSSSSNNLSSLNLNVIGSPPYSFVHVPTHFFKILLAVPNEFDRLSPGGASSSPLMASFILPNQPVPSNASLKDYQVPLEAVELYSGWQFFSRLQRDGSTKKKSLFSSSSAASTSSAAADPKQLIPFKNLCATGACDMKK